MPVLAPPRPSRFQNSQEYAFGYTVVLEGVFVSGGDAT